jgi:hypothetical protein
MTSRTTTTMPHSQRHKPDMEPVRDFTQPLPQVADRPVCARHIVVSRSKFAQTISRQGRNVRLAIWLPGWHIEIYDEFGEQSYLFGAR